MAKRSGLDFYNRKKTAASGVIKEVFSWIFGLFLSVFIAGVLAYFYGMTSRVVGVSMEPTLYNEQKVLVDRFSYLLSTPKRGDVVVFLPNGNENAHYYVKRVVAVPGDHVRITDGVLYVNGLETTWIKEKILEPGIAKNVLTMASGEYFCIGDNPNNSEDSRSANIGPVEEADIVGRAWFHMKNDEGRAGFIK